jgi:hypothetical protein
MQGIEPELQIIVRHKTASTFEELVAITQKYAKRVRFNQNEIEKNRYSLMRFQPMRMNR